MKKLLIIAAFTMMAGILSAQNNVVIQNDGTHANPVMQDNAYYINGISTRDDVGGVEIARGKLTQHRFSDAYLLSFRNYNNFPVSVIYELDDASRGTTTGTIVLNAGETKSSNESYRDPGNFKLIARKMDAPTVYQNQTASPFPPQQPVDASSGQIKLGYISSDEIIAEMPEYKTIQTKLNQLTSDLTSQLEKLQNEFNAKLAVYNQEKGNLSEAVEDMRLKELQNLSQKMADLQEKSSGEVSRTQQMLMAPLLSKFQSALESVGAANGYSFIFDSSHGAILYKGAGATNLDNLVKRKLGITN